MVKFKNKSRIDGTTFECQLQCTQCTGRTRAGARCRRRVCIGTTRCFTHRRTQDSLVVKKSLIPNAGRGVFTTRRIPRGQTIGYYHGEVIDGTEVDERYGIDPRSNAPYTISASRTRHPSGNRNVDSACVRSVLSMARSQPL